MLGLRHSLPQRSWAAAPRTRISLRSSLQPCRATPVITQMPIFPISMVAFPASTVPLMIFEARYRVLFNTLLAGEDRVEEGLVQTASPFAGSKRFGMLYQDGEGRLASVGTVLEIVDFAQLEDGRLFVTAKGRERFKVLDITARKPVMTCQVELLEEEEEETEELKALANEVGVLLMQSIALNKKMKSNQGTVPDEELDIKELDTLGPRELSFWIMSYFTQYKLLQQIILEEASVEKRLQREKDVLTETVNWIAAQSALKSAFGGFADSPESSATSSTPEGSGDKTDN